MKFVALFFLVFQSGYYKNPDYVFDVVDFDSRAECEADFDAAVWQTQRDTMNGKRHDWLGGFACIQIEGPVKRFPIREQIAEGWERA